MFNFQEFFQKVKVEKKISKQDLKVFISNTMFVTNKVGVGEYSGYSIKNAIESFLNYVSDIIYNESSAFYVSKKDLNEVLSELGFKIDNLPSGAYENEVFKVLNLDVQYFNRKIVQFLGEICKEYSTIKDFNFLNKVSEKKVSLYDLYRSSSPTYENKKQTLCEVFSTIYAYKMADFIYTENGELLFSFYRPLELYDSWYIGSIFINKEKLSAII